MKRIIIVILLVFLKFNSNAQDLVVTSKNDSINAKITKVKKEMLYFKFMKGNKLTSTLIPISEVKTYKKNFFTSSEIPEGAKLGSDYKGKRFRISLNGGYGFRTASIQSNLPAELKNHLKGLTSGFAMDVDVSYFISEQLGLGINYSRYNASNYSSNLQATFDGATELGLQTNNIINYVGPSVIGRLISSNEKGALISLFSLGYISYQTEEEIGSRLIKAKGSSFGFSLGVGYDFMVSKNISLGILASLTSGVIKEMEVTEGSNKRTIDLKEESGEVENLGRLGISAGIRFHL